MNETALDCLKALADPTRLRIISLVNALPNICVCQLLETLGLPQTTVSKALGVLKRAGLVTDSRDGQWVRYKLAVLGNDFPLKDILDSAKSIEAVCGDLSKLEKIKKAPLEKICRNKPWRK